MRSKQLSFFLLAILSFFVFWAKPSHANIFVKDDRVAVTPRAGELLATIGRLVNTVDQSAGTAFLVSRCHILTNFHVAFSDEELRDSKEVSLFSLSEDHNVPARIVAHGDYYPANDNENLVDWALLKLDSCLGEKYGWLELTEVDRRELSFMGPSLQMAGFPFDRSSEKLTLEPKCQIYSEPHPVKSGWRHDCATRSGSSGSPLILGHQVVAMNSASAGHFMEIVSHYDVGLSNAAVPMSEILPRIRSYLEADTKR